MSFPAPNELVGVLPLGAGAWQRARAWQGGARIVLTDRRLEIMPEIGAWDFSDCVLAGSTICPSQPGLLTLDVRRSDLTGVTIAPGSHVRLLLDARTVLTNATLADITLSDTSFVTIELSGVNFLRSRLARVELSRTMRQVDLGLCSLEDAQLVGATLRGCSLASAQAKQCDFDGADFSSEDGANPNALEKAAFERCTFVDAQFGQSSLSETQFIECDLRRARGLVLDDTVVRHTAMSPDADDLWSTLRRTYTGTKMIFNLIATLIFFLPFVFQALYWSGVNQLELAALHGLDAAQAELAKIPSEARRAEVAAALRRALPAELEKCMRPKAGDVVLSHPRCLQTWQVLLGIHEGPWTAWLSAVLLFYNLCRLVLTWFVGPLNDAQQTSFHTPRRSSYAWMRYPHYVVSVLLWLALAAGAAHLLPHLLAPVWLGNV